MTPPDHVAIEQLLGRIIQDFMMSMHRTGLSGPQIHALLYIYHAGDCRVSELAMLSDSSAAAASQFVERLVQQGLVQRTEDPANRRIKNVRLAEKSLKLIHEAITSNRLLADLMAALSPSQRKTVHTALGYLAQAGQHVYPSPIHPSHTRKVEHHAPTS
jgi:DNA-binding MarR family transcriptional regulator